MPKTYMNEMKIAKMPLEMLFRLLQKANDRRKTVERNMRKYAKRYYEEIAAHGELAQKLKDDLRKWQNREWELQQREDEVKRWRDRVNELVNQETAQHNALFALQTCSRCEEKQWRRKYRQTFSGMSEFCGKYINIVDDMMRQKNLPDNIKARLCDMRVAFIESREFLDKVMKEKPDKQQEL